MPKDNFFLMKTTVVSQESRNSNVISLSGSFILEIVFFKNVSRDLRVFLCSMSSSSLHIFSLVLYDGFCGVLGMF